MLSPYFESFMPFQDGTNIGIVIDGPHEPTRKGAQPYFNITQKRPVVSVEAIVSNTTGNNLNEATKDAVSEMISALDLLINDYEQAKAKMEKLQSDLVSEKLVLNPLP